MATAKDTIRDLFEKVKVPINLTARQVEIARAYALNQMSDKISMADFAKDYNLSTKTFYAWKKDVPHFEKYVNELLDNSVTDSVKDALNAMDKHVMKLAYQTSVTPAEIKIFGDYFGYALEARKRQYLKDNGLNSDGNKPELSVEEKRDRLLKRLRGEN